MEESHIISRTVSCLALLLVVSLSGLAATIFVWQCIHWLIVGEWVGLPLRVICEPHSSWIGLQIILEWIFSLPIALTSLMIGLVVFKLIGMLSDYLYTQEANKSGKVATPSQTHP
jgi:hypothetical protein